MKKKLPFEEAIEGKLQQAALPDKEQSWQAMEALLNKKKKRRGTFFFTGYPVLLLLLLLGTITWLLVHNRQKEKKIGTTQNENRINSETARENNTAADRDKIEKINEGKNVSAQKNEMDTKNNTAGVQTNDNSTAGSNLPRSSNNSDYSNTIQQYKKRKHITKGKTTANVFSPASYKADDTGDANDKNNNGKAPSPEVKDIHNKINAINADDDNIRVDSLQEAGNNKNTLITKSNNNTDSAVKEVTQLKTNTKADTNNLKKTDVAKSTTSLKQKNEIKKFSWSAGIAIQQQIPVDGQKITRYGYNGSSNVIDDYIPSVYVRWQKKNKWFIQAEFGYGTPRPVAEFSYSRSTEVNNTSTEISTTTLKLKKTYYHQIPVSFNYYIKKNWSVGAGVMYGILHRSVTERELAIKNIQSQQETRSSNIISSGFTDSFLYKKQYHWLLQTNYEWKKLSFGIRYSKDVLPYIKYTMPSGELNEQKNQTLSFIIMLRPGR